MLINKNKKVQLPIIAQNTNVIYQFINNKIYIETHYYKSNNKYNIIFKLS